MKKKNLKTLKLSKKTISAFSSHLLMGGTDHDTKFLSCLQETEDNCPPKPPETLTYCGWDCLGQGSQHINCQNQ